MDIPEFRETAVIEDYYKDPDSLIMTDSATSALSLKGLDEKPLEEILSFIERFNCLEFYAPWQDLLHEEMLPYYKDEISLDEAIENATDMLEIYISE